MLFQHSDKFLITLDQAYRELNVMRKLLVQLNLKALLLLQVLQALGVSDSVKRLPCTFQVKFHLNVNVVQFFWLKNNCEQKYNTAYISHFIIVGGIPLDFFCFVLLWCMYLIWSSHREIQDRDLLYVKLQKIQCEKLSMKCNQCFLG